MTIAEDLRQAREDERRAQERIARLEKGALEEIRNRYRDELVALRTRFETELAELGYSSGVLDDAESSKARAEAKTRKRPALSDEERQRRSERMKNAWQTRRGKQGSAEAPVPEKGPTLRKKPRD
jgi:hypothetical protein